MYYKITIFFSRTYQSSSVEPEMVAEESASNYSYVCINI